MTRVVLSGYDAGPGMTRTAHPGYDAGPGAVRAADPEPEPIPASGPIFVDASGRRRKLARRASLAAVAVLAGYTGLLAVSFAGGPIPPKELLPVPGIPAGRQQAPASSAPAGAAPSGKSSADHVADRGRSTAGTSDHQAGARTGASGGSPGQSAPSEPSPTASGTAPAAPPSPTGTSAAASSSSSHGNPTPPGHSRHKTPSPSQST
jgi:hypothetical protein